MAQKSRWSTKLLFYKIFQAYKYISQLQMPAYQTVLHSQRVKYSYRGNAQNHLTFSGFKLEGVREYSEARHLAVWAILQELMSQAITTFAA